MLVSSHPDHCTHKIRPVVHTVLGGGHPQPAPSGRQHSRQQGRNADTSWVGRVGALVAGEPLTSDSSRDLVGASRPHQEPTRGNTEHHRPGFFRCTGRGHPMKRRRALARTPWEPGRALPAESWRDRPGDPRPDASPLRSSPSLAPRLHPIRAIRLGRCPVAVGWRCRAAVRCGWRCRLRCWRCWPVVPRLGFGGAVCGLTPERREPIRCRCSSRRRVARCPDLQTGRARQGRGEYRRSGGRAADGPDGPSSGPLVGGPQAGCGAPRCSLPSAVPEGWIG